MDSKARIRSANYLANLINQAYQAKPDIFGTDEKFELSSDVMKKKYLDLLVKHLEKLLSIKIHPNTRKTVESLWAKMDRRKAPLNLALAVPMKTIQITGTPLQLMQEQIKQPKNQMRKMIDLIDYTVIRECDNSIVTFPYFLMVVNKMQHIYTDCFLYDKCNFNHFLSF